MFDFNKILEESNQSIERDPIKIYESLDRMSDAGPLRQSQKSVLSSWYMDYKHKKTVILKLHTGQGKTLIGLLALKAKLAENKGLAVYLCPNKQLVEQTARQAERFGIKYFIYDKEDILPSEFMEGSHILITHVQKYFNGRSKFGIGNKSLPIDYFVVDDSHTCIEEIRRSFTISVDRDSPVYKGLLEIFEEDLQNQGTGTYKDIINGEYEAFLAIPYWSWIDKENEVINLLSENKDKTSILFAWNLIKDLIKKCECIISGSKLEIRPYSNPIEKYQGFDTAKHRLLMSASTLDDSFLIKGLNIHANEIKKPLIYDDETWSGEKMILIPELIDPVLNRVEIINSFGSINPERKFGISSLVPSKWHSKIWEDCGAQVVDKNNDVTCLNQIRNRQFSNTYTFNNRYDGIDLPDDLCRILIIDSKPHAGTLFDLYEEQCRTNSEVVHLRMAQKVEQGLGRSVRGEKDYSVILIIGSDLVNAIRNTKTKKYFSDQTNTQIDMGIHIAQIAKNQNSEKLIPNEVLKQLILKCLGRAEDWKNYYKTNMDSSVFALSDRNNILDILESEKSAEDLHSMNKSEKAISIIQGIIDSENFDSSEKGWYLQTIARYQYPLSKSRSNEFQVVAHNCNHFLLKPRDGMKFEKLKFIDQTRVENVINRITSFASYEDLSLSLQMILDQFSFRTKAKNFESSVMEIGNFLGFLSQRPETEWKEGSDNLWCVKNGSFFLIECKSQVHENRDQVDKVETGQMNNSIAWFERRYGSAEVTRILIIPTKKIAKGTGFNKEVLILRKKGMTLLKKNLKSFYNEFKDVDFHTLDGGKVNTLLRTHFLDIDQFITSYLESPYFS